ncbi:hypothetical protein ABZ686_10505, partial [Streptomyces sp. NPDC006992]|uniref:hypothetical protein n=1 Tax=Streptomyces sp. NPDC006992 TaxID=3155601 RepID=UPI0033E577B3
DKVKGSAVNPVLREGNSDLACVGCAGSGERSCPLRAPGTRVGRRPRRGRVLRTLRRPLLHHSAPAYNCRSYEE